MNELDTELYERVIRQDKKALELLYERYEKLLFSFAYRMTKRKELSEEIVQEVFIKLWTKPGIYDQSKGKFSSWLLTVTRNTSIDQLRRKNEQNYEIEERDSLQENEPSIEEQIEWKEEGRRLQKAMKFLAKEQKEIVELFYFKGLSQSKIAEVFQIPLGTVKGRLRLALKHLRKDLDSTGQGRDSV
ncbi:RNA polymerase sigma factor [Pseudalkalibacillus sp. SCS-8]|uniref:RNA polymerase sigma factor n=1 Tax=Pseudalkalibacillus nanhaiensis TaxID=3115291 RepID=UPI0032DB3C1A